MTFIQNLQTFFQDQGIPLVNPLGEYQVSVTYTNIVDILTSLKSMFQFSQLSDMSTVDYLSQNQHFHVFYQLLNMNENIRLRVWVAVKELQPLPSICSVYKAANWYEREIFDMFGISFEGHPNLERILTDYTFQEHPLRKDFPCEGLEEVTMDDSNSGFEYEDVKLFQNKRSFSFHNTKWYSPTYEEGSE